MPVVCYAPAAELPLADIIVRKAEISDAETVYDFVLKLDCEDAPVRPPAMSVDDIIAAGFGDDPLFEAFVAQARDGKPLGIVSFYRGYSGWFAKPVARVHMLIVDEGARGQGIGRKLIAAVAALAVERGWVRLELLVEEGQPAAGFYQSIGMENCREDHYRLEGRALSEFSASCFNEGH